MTTPASVPAVKRQIRALAESIVGERADKSLLVPVLMRTLSVEVTDFVRYFGDVSEAESRMKDHAILLASPITKRKRIKVQKCPS